MKASLCKQYGSPETLTVGEIAPPKAGPGELLVRVYASTVSRTDCAILAARPFIMRFFTGLFRPKKTITGTDFAGIVEATGPGTSAFQPGDRVCGFSDLGLCSHAEFLVIREKSAIAPIPQALSFEQAAACMEGAHYARNFLNKISLQPGQKALVNGATGAIGSALLQFLKAHGLYVTAVCNTPNLALIRSLGADKLIDYLRQDFTADDEVYYYVLDAVGKSTFGQCKHLLKPRGIYCSSELGPGCRHLFLALLTRFTRGKRVIFPVPTSIKGSLAYTLGLAGNGLFRPVIDRRYSIHQVADAYTYVASGQKTGNVILTPGSDEL